MHLYKLGASYNFFDRKQKISNIENVYCWKKTGFQNSLTIHIWPRRPEIIYNYIEVFAQSVVDN